MAKNKKRILVTSALPYVNNVPHLGNIIGSTLSADVFARFHKSKENEIIYICGTDEHGTATEAKALEEGLTPKQICDKYYKIHKEIYGWFNISFDIFGRTSSQKHHEITKEIFLKLHKNGYISEDEIEQLFCEEDNKFLADRFVAGTCPHCGFKDARGDQCDNCGKLLDPTDLKDPRCKIHGTTPVLKKTRHLFLDLQKLQPKLEQWFKKQSKDGFWPQNAVTTTSGWLKKGLEKRAITRDLSWGVKVPLENYKNKVFYVWFDAPIGYISITAELTKKWEKWWKKPGDVFLYQFMAKDNIPFHTIVFPATLIGTREPYTMLYHISSTEYLQYEGGKFSKSRGIGVFGDDAKNSGIPSDAYRYYLLINRPESADTVFSWEEFGARINNELAANLGNFVNRTLSFIDKYQEGKISPSNLEKKEKDFWQKITSEEKKAEELLEKAEIKQALKTIMGISQAANQYFQESQPWRTRTEEPDACKKSLYILANLVKDLGILIEPFLPATSKRIFEQLNTKEKSWQDLGKFSIKAHKIGKPKILFEKIEEKKITELKSRFSGQKNKEEKSERTSENLFSLLDLKVGKITDVKNHPNADKLYVEEIDLGSEKRQIVSGLADYYSKSELLGKKVVVVANLEPAMLRGVLSSGMLLAAESSGKVGILFLEKAKEGEQVTIDKVHPLKGRISVSDFLKINMHLKDGVAYFGAAPLAAGKEKVKADRIKEGKVS